MPIPVISWARAQVEKGVIGSRTFSMHFFQTKPPP